MSLLIRMQYSWVNSLVAAVHTLRAVHTARGLRAGCSQGKDLGLRGFDPEIYSASVAYQLAIAGLAPQAETESDFHQLSIIIELAFV